MNITYGVKEEIKTRLSFDYSSRKLPVTVLVDGKPIDMTIGKLFLNILLLKPFAMTETPVNEEDIFTESSITQDGFEELFNHILDRLSDCNVTYSEIRESLIESMNEMCDLSGDYNVKVGYSVSFRDFVRMEVEDEKAAGLFNPDIKPGAFHKIEDDFNECGKKLMEYFRNHKETELHPFVISETGINKKQFTQCVGFVGLKPDMEGNVIPITVKDNFLHGLSGLEGYFINSLGTRKALCTNSKMTRRSGYLTRKLSLSNIDHYHDDNIKDCGTTHFVKFSVDNKRKLNQIIDRHYYLLDDDGNKLSDELFTVSEESDIIGKVIGLRSPVTCCGKHVCATCYGRKLSAINRDVNTGLVATNKLTEPLTQRLLSAKHLLSTKTDKIEWGEDFTEIFSVNMDSIYFQPETECSISFKKPSLEEFDEDENMYYVSEINILLSGNKKATTYISPVRLFINPKILSVEKMKDDDTDINFNSKSLDEDDFVFKYQAKNTELTQSLQEILDLIETSDHLGIIDYNDFVNKFDDLLIENDLDYINSIHIEMISAVLVRDAETGKRLDFSKKDLDAYTIDRVSKSVMNGPLAVSLSFERINDQLIDLNTYEKDEVSMMDNLFL